MVFSSITFLFYFLPLYLLAFWGSGFSKTVTAVFSIVFYAWGEPVFVLLLLASILANYFLGLAIERRGGGSRPRLLLALGVAGNLAPLLWFKYSVFVAHAVGTALGSSALALPFAPEGLPLGISFYTFHAISYLVDVYRRDTPAERSIRDMVLYVSMFPQLVAGPLIRYKTISGQLHRPDVSPDRASRGVQLFIVGLSQKVLIANSLSTVADAIFALPPDKLSAPLSWLGIICYTLQIYYDFGGYSKMAIGLGLIIGFNFPLNFNYPYVARSMTDFWRRWHISLSLWFRDYVYVPLGGNRLSPARTYLNLWIVFLLCGLWHGAAWTFVVWGALHGGLLVLERIGFGQLLTRLPIPMQHAYVLLCVAITWVFFRADTLGHAGWYLAAMFGMGSAGPLTPPLERFVHWDVLLALAAGVLTAGPYGVQAAGAVRIALGQYLAPATRFSALAGLLALVAMSLAGGAYNPFIYFRF